MNTEQATKIINCKNQIKRNNEEIAELSKQNVRLFNSLISMLSILPKETKERYDKELASDNWKKYSKNYQKSIGNTGDAFIG